MRAIIVGAVESTRVTLRAVADAEDWQVVALITLPPELAARHSDFADLSAEAEAAGAKVIHAANSNAPELLSAVAELAADVVFVIGWSQICKPGFIAAAGGRVIGYHPAPLPRLRGRGVIPWTILKQEPITAGTLFWIDEGVDSGPILIQHFLHVAPDETAETLYGRHLQVLEAMLKQALDRLSAGQFDGVPQDERFATWAAKRSPEDGRICWNEPATDVARLVRAVGRPYPGAFTGYGGEKLIIWSAEPCPRGQRHMASPGQVTELEADGFTVSCGDGNGLRVTDWELPSGRRPRLHARLGTAEIGEWRP